MSHYFKYSFLILAVACLFSCKSEQKETTSTTPEEIKDSVNVDVYEQFERIDITDFIKKVSASEKTLAPEDIMRLYYPRQAASEEGNQTITVDTKALSATHSEVTLVHDNLLDDSMKALKLVMRLQKKDEKWAVVSLQKNWQCREGRGHTDWGIGLCK